MRQLIENLAVWTLIRFASSSRYELILNRLIAAAQDYHQDSSHERGPYWIVPVQSPEVPT